MVSTNETSLLTGGGSRNRTGVHGFAGRCITTLPSRLTILIDVVLSIRFTTWSGKRVSNSRPQPWQGCALPTELFPHKTWCVLLEFQNDGAGNESRTRDLNLGKVALYQLSYSRISNLPLLKSLERETSLELATSTLARLRSTN